MLLASHDQILSTGKTLRKWSLVRQLTLPRCRPDENKVRDYFAEAGIEKMMLHSVLQIASARVCSRLELPGGLRFNKLPIHEIPSKASVQVADHHILS